MVFGQVIIQKGPWKCYTINEFHIYNKEIVHVYCSVNSGNNIQTIWLIGFNTLWKTYLYVFGMYLYLYISNTFDSVCGYHFKWLYFNSVWCIRLLVSEQQIAIEISGAYPFPISIWKAREFFIARCSPMWFHMSPCG